MIKFTKDWNYLVNGLCIYGGEKMNKEIFDLNKIVDEIDLKFDFSYPHTVRLLKEDGNNNLYIDLEGDIDDELLQEVLTEESNDKMRTIEIFNSSTHTLALYNCWRKFLSVVSRLLSSKASCCNSCPMCSTKV